MQENNQVDQVVSVSEAVAEAVAEGQPLATEAEVQAPNSTEAAQTDDFTLEEVLAEGSQATEVAKEQEVTEKAPETSEEDEEAKPYVPKLNAQIFYPTSGPRSQGSPDEIALPAGTEKDYKYKFESLPNLDVVVSTQQHHWVDVLSKGVLQLPMGEVYSDRLDKEGSDFQQKVTHQGRDLRAQTPSFKSKPGSRVMEGENALLQVVTHLGVGSLIRVPLWNSGIWVSFKPATEDEMLELNRTISSDKISLGRWSYGLALSNHVVYTLERVFDFALKHVYYTSVKSDELPISSLRDHIAPQDINSFIWGFLCANYPSGFHYSVSCINNPVKCSHVIEENLNLSKLQWTDSSALSEWQKEHMSTMASNSKSLDSVKRYKEEFKALQKKRIILNEGTDHEIAITIKTPTISEYVTQGHRWIAGIVESVDRALTEEVSISERNSLINSLGKASSLCQYVHWIESIEYGELTETGKETDGLSQNIIVDLNTIEKTLKVLSATDSIREKIIEEVLKYISDSTISVIGIPSYDCPKCSAPQDDTSNQYPRHTSIIPLDILQVFFALLTQRLSRIETR